MKRYIRCLALILAAALLLGQLAGCGGAAPELTEEAQTLRSDITSGGLTLSQSESGKRLTPLTTRSNGALQTKDYTVMVYMVGSDLESQGGYASSDILEMLDSGMSGRSCNLLVYTGGAASWDLNIRSDVNTVYALNEAGDTLEEVASTGQSVNMGAADTLLDFLTYAHSNYPAEKYGLIFWDHGGGPLYGFGSDELYGYDGLSIWEMQSALESSPFREDKLDFVGFDACLMASIEVAAMLSGYADYLIASEEVEPGSGWDYSFLKTLNTNTDTMALLESILDAYRLSMEADFWKPDYTLSCVDLGALEGVVTALDGVWTQMRGELEEGGYASLARSRNQTKRFGISAVSDRGSSFDLVDLGDMLDQLGGDYSAAVQAVEDALNKAVVRQVTNIEGAGGLSMYYPYDNKNLYQQGGNLYDFSSLMGGYHSYMDLFASQWLTAETDVRWAEDQKLQVQEDYLTLQLQPDQLENLGSVTYTVLRYDEDTGAYSGLVSGLTAVPDENGVVRIPRNPDVFMMHTDTTEVDSDGTLWPVTLVEAGLTKNRYVSYSSTLFTTNDVIVGGTEPIQITLSDNAATGEVTIQSILSRNWADTEFYGRQDVDIDNWGVVAYNWNPLYPTYDVEGNLLPWEEWETDGSFWYTLCNYEETFWFEKMSLQEMEGLYYCQVTMYDSSGNVIGARLEELFINTPYEDKTLTVEAGRMTFRVYSDHAELTAFEGTDDGDWLTSLDLTVEIPAEVSGVPVTVIGPNVFANAGDIGHVVVPDTVEEIDYRAFYYCRDLTSIELPDTLKTLGNYALAFTDLTEIELPESLRMLGYESFAGTELTSVTIPAGVELVGAGSFANCEFLKSIAVAEGNEYYKSVDGVLFTADGKKLVAFPGAWGEKYDVPAGVEIIGDEAFRANKLLTTLNLNEGLKVIDRLAFCNAPGLLYIDLPESLEVIGAAAFGVTVLGEKGTDIPVLKIGANVRFIGDEAFSGYNIRAIEVAEGNEYYSSANGCLLNASGTRLLQVPKGYEGTLEIPEGVSYLGWYSLYYCKNVTELILPDSLVAINHAAGIPANLERVVVGKGLKDWQNVTSFFEVPVIEIDPENADYTMTEDGSIYSKDMTKLLLCRSEEADVVIPEGVTAIGVGALKSLYGDAATMKTLSLPSTLAEIPDGVFINLTALERITVAEGNPNFAAWDGLLYTRDGKTLITCPQGITGTITVREGTLELAPYAIYSSGLKADTVVIPEGVTVMRYGSFLSLPYNSVLTLYLPESLTDIHPDTFEFVDAEEIIVYCPAGSAAEAHAKACGMTVVNN